MRLGVAGNESCGVGSYQMSKSRYLHCLCRQTGLVGFPDRLRPLEGGRRPRPLSAGPARELKAAGNEWIPKLQS